MSKPVPLGRRGGLRLEFKSAAALERPDTIGKEVAAMLNAAGGEIWIGIRDRHGTAAEVQPICDPSHQAESLLDSLIDRLEPSPLAHEVRVEPVRVDDEISVLRIEVTPTPERRPYALLKSGGWYFPVRAGGRMRPMSREEIFHREPEGDLGATAQIVAREREEFHKAGMWLRLQPAADVQVDVSGLAGELRDELLTDPSKSSNRRTGWHFARAWKAPELCKGKVQWGWGSPNPAFEAAVLADGGMLFTASLGTLHWKGDEREIWPLALLEYPVSAFRLARVIYQGLMDDEIKIVAELALFGIRGWKLRGGSPPGRSAYQVNEAVEYPDPDENLTWAKPLVFRYREIRETPDRCGFRLVRRVYEAFGLPETAIPREYDRDSGRLVLPE